MKMNLSRREWVKLGAGVGTSLLPGVSKAADALARATGSAHAKLRQKWAMGVDPAQTLPPEATNGPWKNLRAVKEKKVFDVHCHCIGTPVQGHRLTYKEDHQVHVPFVNYTNDLIAEMDRHGVAQAALTPSREPYETIVKNDVLQHLDRFVRSSGMPTEGSKGKDLTPRLVADIYRTHLERDHCVLIGETAGDAMRAMLHSKKYTAKDFKPIADVVMEHDVPVQMHMGWSGIPIFVGSANYPYQAAWRWAEDMGSLLTEYPDIKFIMGHTGGPLAEPDGREAVRLAFSFDNAYVDTSTSPPEIVTQVVRGIGAERVMFGSDFNSPHLNEHGPFHFSALYQYWYNLNTIANADITEDQRDWVLYRSARKLLKLPEV